MHKVLIVDDERKIRRILGEILDAKGFLPVEASSGDEAIDLFRRQRPEVVLLDLKMPGMDGNETMRRMREIDPDVPIIIITAHGNVPTAVESIKLGAYDFILKPPDFNALLLTLNRAVEKLRLEREVKRLHGTVEPLFQNLLGSSPAMKVLAEQMQQVARSDFSVIIQGETGTGKSFFAREIHHLSGRAQGPFVTVDIGAIPEPLVESELFGYERGAFTGAERKKEGFFAVAGNGTLFLDEMENISLYMQSKLLRVVEEKRICPLGSTRPQDIDVRIITASNIDMRQALRQKKFREDLFYRLGEMIITLPPLRERKEDIPLLARKFLHEAAEELNKTVRDLADDAVGALQGYSWPGNVRELKNIIRRAVLFVEGPVIGREQIVIQIRNGDAGPDCSRSFFSDGLPCRSLKDFEVSAIRQALALTQGNKRKAAFILQIDYTTLLRKIKQYGISGV